MASKEFLQEGAQALRLSKAVSKALPCSTPWANWAAHSISDTCLLFELVLFRAICKRQGNLGHSSSTALLSIVQDQPSLSNAWTASPLLSPCFSFNGMPSGPPHPAPTAFNQAVEWLGETLRNLSCPLVAARRPPLPSTNFSLASNCFFLAPGSRANSKAIEPVSSSCLTPTDHIFSPLFQQSIADNIWPARLSGWVNISLGLTTML